MNDAGHFYPAWGICLGHEYLVGYTATAGDDILDAIVAEEVSLPLDFAKPPEDTHFYKSLGDDAQKFEKNAYTYNAHHWGLSPEKFKADEGLSSFWDVTAISYVPNNGTDPMPFVASLEAKDYPIFSTQFHPEKPSQLWTDNDGINHTWESINLQKQFSEFIVKLSRENPNRFADFDAEVAVDIMNYNMIFTENHQSWVYVFE